MPKTFIGTTPEGENVYIEWKLKNGEFSASGEIWNKSGSDINSGGQNLDEIVELFPESQQAFDIWLIWKYYHLNYMRAGSPKQMELVKGQLALERAEAYDEDLAEGC